MKREGWRDRGREEKRLRRRKEGDTPNIYGGFYGKRRYFTSCLIMHKRRSAE